MQYKICQLMWVVPLLIFITNCHLLTHATKYDQQVIAILEDNPEIQKAGHFLYRKHDTTSYVVKWNKDTKAFERVEWNEQTQSHQPIQDPEPLPIRPEGWHKTRIQVVGHGEINGKDTKIAGFPPDSLAETLVNGLKIGDVGRISIVGCTRPGGNRNKPGRPDYLDNFMKKLRKLKRLKTEVSLRSDLVSVDQSGRKLTGGLVLLSDPHSPDIGIEWTHKNPSKKWIAKFTGKQNNKIDISQTTATESGPIASYFFGILPRDSNVYVSTYKQGADQPTKTYKIDDPQAFKWLDRVAQNTYMNIPEG